VPVDLARAYLDGGARFLQVRAKQLGSGPLLELCDAVVRVATAYQAIVLVNDRADVARMAGAAGVHVGQDDVPPSAARALLGPDSIIGYSTHSVQQIQLALSERAMPQPISYIAVGPVFGSTTKETGYIAVGLDLVSAAARLSGPPVVAIGGITLENARSVIDAGAACVAVISDLLTTRDAAGRTRAYLQTLAQHRV
jgi:thiamine-phosphate pyrophosphorylase